MNINLKEDAIKEISRGRLNFALKNWTTAVIIKVPRINLSCGRKKSGNDKKLKVTNLLFAN